MQNVVSERFNTDLVYAVQFVDEVKYFLRIVASLAARILALPSLLGVILQNRNQLSDTRVPTHLKRASFRFILKPDAFQSGKESGVSALSFMPHLPNDIYWAFSSCDEVADPIVFRFSIRR